MSRRCEVLTTDGTWREVPIAELAAGSIFRLFDGETGRPIEDADGARRWRALGPPGVGEDGAPVIDAEQVPESEVERQVREGGMFWPGAASRAPGPPRRLR